jgi:hypothetical protein
MRSGVVCLWWRLPRSWLPVKRQGLPTDLSEMANAAKKRWTQVNHRLTVWLKGQLTRMSAPWPRNFDLQGLPTRAFVVLALGALWIAVPRFQAQRAYGFQAQRAYSRIGQDGGCLQRAPGVPYERIEVCEHSSVSYTPDRLNGALASFIKGHAESCWKSGGHEVTFEESGIDGTVVSCYGKTRSPIWHKESYFYLGGRW